MCRSSLAAQHRAEKTRAEQSRADQIRKQFFGTDPEQPPLYHRYTTPLYNPALSPLYHLQNLNEIVIPPRYTTVVPHHAPTRVLASIVSRLEAVFTAAHATRTAIVIARALVDMWMSPVGDRIAGSRAAFVKRRAIVSRSHLAIKSLSTWRSDRNVVPNRSSVASNLSRLPRDSIASGSLGDRHGLGVANRW